jgi:MiaB/RimO family radical SAM methylthiotransferase
MKMEAEMVPENTKAMKRVFLTATSDCILAKYELERINTYFQWNGWKVVDDRSKADMIILNTCGLIPYKEAESLSCVDEYITFAGEARELVLTGCLVKMNCKALEEKFRGFKFGRTETTLLDKYIGAKYPLDFVKNFKLLNEEHPETGFIRISQGCTGKCTYCAIKMTKGPLKSIPLEDVLRDIRHLIDQGSYYILLLGDDVGCYGVDLNTDFAYLLKGILEIEKKFNLFIYNFEPSYLIKLGDRLLPLLMDKRIGTLKVPIQSGSQKILKLMNRHYNVQDVLKLTDKIKTSNPEITLISHIMVGFPQETEEDVAKSLEVANHFDEMVILTYGPREGLPSTRLAGQISEDIKLQRLHWMKQQLAGHKKACFMDSSKGVLI